MNRFSLFTYNLRKIGTGLFFLTVLFGQLFSLAPVQAFSAGTSPDLGVRYQEASGLSKVDVRITVARVIRVALGFIGIILVAITTYAGFQWMTAGGNEDKIADAKKWIYSSVIGLIIILTSYAIVTFVTSAMTDVTSMPT